MPGTDKWNIVSPVLEGPGDSIVASINDVDGHDNMAVSLVVVGSRVPAAITCFRDQTFSSWNISRRVFPAFQLQSLAIWESL